MRRIPLSCAITGFIFCIFSCQPKVEYIRPEIKTFTVNNSTDTLLTSDHITAVWTGNDPACEFSYVIYASGSASPVFPSWGKTVSLDTMLDDGKYIFQVSTRYAGKTDTTLRTLQFSVKALSQKSIALTPRFQTISGETANLTVITDGISALYTLHLKFKDLIIRDVKKHPSLDKSAVFFVPGEKTVTFLNLDLVNLKSSETLMTITATGDFSHVKKEFVIDSCSAVTDVTDTPATTTFTTRGAFILKK